MLDDQRLSFSAASRRVGSLTVNLLRLILAWVMLAGYCLAVRGQVWPGDASWRTWGWLSLSGLVGYFMGDMCGFQAFVLIGPRLTMLVTTLAPPMAAVLGLLVLGQQLSLWSWLGMAVTLAGVGWVVLEPRPRRRRPRAKGDDLGSGSGRAVLGGPGGRADLQQAGHGPRPTGQRQYDPFAANQIRMLAGLVAFAAMLGLMGRYPRVAAALRKRKLWPRWPWVR